MDWIRGWIRKRPLTWLIVLFALGGILGSAVSSSENQDLKRDTGALESDIAVLEDNLGKANDEATAARGVASKSKALKARERRLNRREAALIVEEVQAEQSIISDGIWQVGVDIEPGTYRAEGGESCYWALLNSADTQDIVNNGGFGPNQTITIDSAWFETNDCGEWEKIE